MITDNCAKMRQNIVSNLILQETKHTSGNWNKNKTNNAIVLKATRSSVLHNTHRSILALNTLVVVGLKAFLH